MEDWNVYGMEDWLEHYSKVLPPGRRTTAWSMATTTSYSNPGPDNADITLTETLIEFMREGGTFRSIWDHTTLTTTTYRIRTHQTGYPSE